MSAPPAPDPVAAHVAALARKLRGPARARRSMLAETRGGLDDAAAAYCRGGLHPERAAELAVRDFGPVSEIAPLYQDELAARQGRRTALLLLVMFPGMVVGWDLVWSSGVAGWDSGHASAAVTAMARVQDVASIVVAVAALVLFAITFRRAPSARPVTLAVGVTGGLGGLVCGGTAIAMNLVDAAGTWREMVANPLALLAYGGSAAVLALVCRSVVRTLRAARHR